MPFLNARSSAASTTISIVAAALMGLGVVMVFSAGASLTAPSVSELTLSDPSVRQGIFTIAALVIMLGVGVLPYDLWRLRRGTWFQPTVLLSLASVALLAVVLVPGIGEMRNGARRWLSIGPSSMGISFQPSELAKLSLVLLFSAMAGAMGDRIRRFWSGLLPMLVILGVYAALVGIEDFGTAALLAAVGVSILLGAGAKFWHLVLAAVPGMAGIIYLILVKPYRLERLQTFLDPFADPQGSGYHQVQSLITIASGGWWGQGLGAGVQKYGYLPEGRTDFIFSVICEELGLVGGVAVLGLFAVLLWSGRQAMVRAGSEFGRLLVLGGSLMIGFQAAMNVAVVTVSIPTKGIGLPLVSAGGSGVILFGVLLGMMINVARDRGGSLPEGVWSVAPSLSPGDRAAREFSGVVTGGGTGAVAHA